MMPDLPSPRRACPYSRLISHDHLTYERSHEHTVTDQRNTADGRRKRSMGEVAAKSHGYDGPGLKQHETPTTKNKTEKNKTKKKTEQESQQISPQLCRSPSMTQ